MARIPRYLSISAAIDEAIGDDRLQPGMVLVEDPLARHFNTSRTTIRKALNVLFEQQKISRFNGRGFLVGSDPTLSPNRAPIEPLLFNASSAKPTPRSISSQDQILPQLRQALVRALPFGPFRISEADLSETYDVSRTVIRETLSQLRSTGLVRKNEKSNWVLGPLSAHEVRNHYEMRIILEPVALSQSVPNLAVADVEAAWQRLDRLATSPTDADETQLAEIEHELHVELLSGCRNEQLLSALRASSLVLAVNEMFRALVGSGQDNELLVSEHLAVVTALRDGNLAVAANALKLHLQRARDRTCRRLKTLSVLSSPVMPDYLTHEPLSVNQALLA
ncbi:GntR family transcriptional regulator [Roseibium sp. SCP14]|uniref:GntR family transcriptional regulator n=1 Tax=Roseibium sp. SCP14 TaxID=3141375 RepID=UPI00333B7BBF